MVDDLVLSVYSLELRVRVRIQGLALGLRV